jgi:serine protease AprX
MQGVDRMKPWLIAILLGAVSTTASAGAVIGARLAEQLGGARADDRIVAWVSFTDKGSSESLRNAVPRTVVSERSLLRRMKVRPATHLVDYTDLPVSEEYVAAVTAQVSALRQRSRWFNAVSVAATPLQIEALRSLPFVAGIDLVARFRKDQSEKETGEAPLPPPPVLAPTDLNYGPSLNQVLQIGVPAVHNSGNYGQGVMVGVFDNGFRLPNHQAFDSMLIAATYDFVDHKVSVVPNNPDPGFGSHGVNTLSTIGGYASGHLIGPAFGATFILARTENDSSETPIEEDYWAAAIEWADSIGVDVTSTSLGYLTYNAPFTSWTWQNMDGNTTVITRAADMAVGRGILVVNSAGNDGYNASHNTLGAPADGDSVASIGAVNSGGTRVPFSSVGPTLSDPPRIKPDVMAQGSGVVVASSTSPTGYTTSSGTSFSCPLAAGAAALVLKAYPAASPMQILGALKATANNAATPNNLVGWGILNAAAAIDYLQASGVTPNPVFPEGFSLSQNFPNPFNPATTIRYGLPEASTVSLKIYDVMGREVRLLFAGHQTASSYTLQWDGTDDAGRAVSSGMYIYRLTSDRGFSAARSMVLLK